jgi:hypothetical protein
MCASLAPEHLDGFIFGIEEFICHISVLGEYEQSNSKIWDPSNGPQQQSGDFVENKSMIFIKFQ